MVLAVLGPLCGILPAMLVGERHARGILLTLATFGIGLALVIGRAVFRAGVPLSYQLGGFAPPLGIALRADGASAAMLLATAIVVAAATVFAADEFHDRPRAGWSFHMLLLALWSGLNAVFVGADLFNLFVALELLAFAAVPMVCLLGGAATLSAALHYLVFALLGSLLYLLGAALLYGVHGTLDVVLLGAAGAGGLPGQLAVALITVGLAGKTALWPLHFWLPPAHGGAPPPVSALLSALVVKASFFLLLRVWFIAVPWLPGSAAGQLLAGLGAGAILFGGAQALAQARLKLLIAYSTVMQIGYLFIVFAFGNADDLRVQGQAWLGVMLQATSHALAKAAMFMAVGLMACSLGHDRIEALAGIGRRRPLTLAAFAIGGMSLMGLPPSGGFVAKWLLLYASVASGQWWWAVAILAGGLLTGTYLFRVLNAALAAPAEPLSPGPEVRLQRELAVLGLALLSMLLGLLPLASFGLVRIGRFA
jgi:multicomponent Na+:H+ antiporter subunit D